jgi:phosphatidylinositol kinase/protein kinase (PI-3  family)
MLMPSIRKILLQLLTELEYSSSALHKEEAARLLCVLVSRARHLIRLVLKVGVPRLTLGAFTKCQSYAKSLHYKESEFFSEPVFTATIDALIADWN